MTAAERKRRQRAKAQEQGVPTRDQMITAYGRAVIDLAPELKTTAPFAQITEQASKHLSNLGFKRRPVQDALKQVKEGGGTD
ncbi:MAG: hypothetical protein HUJ11_02730 [Arenibacter algicola]|nr:hypothetical protein [Arenibacter algicola]